MLRPLWRRYRDKGNGAITMVYPFIPIGSTGTSGLSPTRTETAGAAITAFDLVAFNTSSEVVPAVSTTASSIWDIAGIAQSSVAAAASVEVSEISGVTQPMRFSVPPGAGANNSPVFLSSIAGVATLTPPASSGNTIFRVGILVGADGATLTPEVLFRPQFIANIP